MTDTGRTLTPRYGPGEDYDGTFHVTDDEDGGRTVAVCPTWDDAVMVAEALSAPASTPSAGGE